MRERERERERKITRERERERERENRCRQRVTWQYSSLSENALYFEGLFFINSAFLFFFFFFLFFFLFFLFIVETVMTGKYCIVGCKGMLF